MKMNKSVMALLIFIGIALLCGCDPGNIIAGGGQAMVSGQNNPVTINNSGVPFWHIVALCALCFYVGRESPDKLPTFFQLGKSAFKKIF